ncbi:hypothetical protein PRIPAC_96116 [Pristionchus pacificus]|uniref:Uncharacterized protein n=1 Tax=Pristionchus pacificus TaxID=54126 RepID=A0A2A6CUX8_PRIPA|nr:hypothetical protein PRIPAC_96116 [Pristionchus pacificus]|eukprot:PDM81886.1 hypothetical protein PRIPAC_34040 [Pristionchus pacificus]
MACRPTCCIPLWIGVWLFTLLCMLLQLGACYVFLYFGPNLFIVFAPVAIILLFHCYFLIIFRMRRIFLIQIFLSYEWIVIVLYCFLLLWTVLRLGDPNGERFANPFLKICYGLWALDNCPSVVQSAVGSLVGICVIGIVCQGT